MDRPWSQLTDDEKEYWKAQMNLKGGHSINGVAGWYTVQRTSGVRYKPVRHRKKPPQLYVPSQGVSVPDSAPEPVTLDDLKDIL